MTESFLTSKNSFFWHDSSTIFWTPHGVAAINKIKQSLLGNLSKMNIFEFLSTPPVLDNNQVSKDPLAYFKNNARSYKTFPMGFAISSVQSFNTFQGLSFSAFVGYAQEDLMLNCEKHIIAVLKWHEELGFKISEIKSTVDLPEVAELFLTYQKTPALDNELFSVDIEVTSGDESFTINLVKAVGFQDKIEYMSAKGVRTKLFVVQFNPITAIEHYVLLLLKQHNFLLPPVINPYPCAILSVSEKWEDLARLVALKLKATADCSSDAVGKKIRNWKALGCSEIYVVGEKDMQELIATGGITLMKNTLEGTIEPVKISFI